MSVVVVIQWFWGVDMENDISVDQFTKGFNKDPLADPLSTRWSKAFYTSIHQMVWLSVVINHRP